jgi:hypothetical protein
MISGFRIGSETMMDPIYSNTLGTLNPDNPTGVLDSAQQILGIGAGEFGAQWFRNHL